MTHLTTKNGFEYWAIEVPEGARKFVLDMGYLIFEVPDYKGGGWVTDKEIEDDVRRFLRTGKSRFSGDSSNLPPTHKRTGIQIPPGNWQYVCTLKDATEEQAREIVDWYGDGNGTVD